MSDEGEWVLMGLDEKLSRRQGMPARVPVPRAEFEGLADKGLSIDKARVWIKEFLTNSEPGKSGAWRKKNSALVGSLEVFIDKAPVWERAQKAFAERDWEKAITALKRIAQMDPDDHAARMNLAAAFANLGDFDGALKAFQAVRKTFEGDPEYHVSVAHVQIARKDTDSAINELVLALEAKPDFQPALDAMVQVGVLAPIYDNPRDAASLTYVRADAVAEYLTGLWDAEPRGVDYFLEQLAYHERELRHAAALAAAERAIAAAGGDVGPERAELARIASLRALGRLGDATDAARAYAAKNPVSSGAEVELAKCVATAGNIDEARAAIERALALDPGDLAALKMRFWPAESEDTIRQIAAALPELRAFAEAHATSPGVWRTLARACLAIGREDESLELFARALDLVPGDDDLRAEYWSELGKRQKYAEMLADAAKIDDMVKRDWKLRWNEAEAYLGLGKRVEARAAFSGINFDASLHVDVRRRAKRAVKSLDEAPAAQEAPAA